MGKMGRCNKGKRRAGVTVATHCELERCTVWYSGTYVMSYLSLSGISVNSLCVVVCVLFPVVALPKGRGAMIGGVVTGTLGVCEKMR